MFHTNEAVSFIFTVDFFKELGSDALVDKVDPWA